jgi:hypothetical protein
MTGHRQALYLVMRGGSPFYARSVLRRSSAPAHETIRRRSGAVCVTAFTSSPFLMRARSSSLTTCRSMSRPLASLRWSLDEPSECDPADNQFHLATSRTECESADAPMRRWRHSSPVDGRSPEPRCAVRSRAYQRIDKGARRLGPTTLERTDAHCASHDRGVVAHRSCTRVARDRDNSSPGRHRVCQQSDARYRERRQKPSP